MAQRSPPTLLSAILCALLFLRRSADAFSSNPSVVAFPGRAGRRPPLALAGRGRPSGRTPLFQSSDGESSEADVAAATEMEAARTREKPKLTPDDRALVRSLCAAGSDAAAVEDAVAANLERMHPRLVVALQMVAEEGEWKEDEDADEDEEFEDLMVTAGTALRNVLDGRLRSGRELLAELLDSGEIRKLDSTIGKAAREGRLDMSFFAVLGMNMRDAAINVEGGETVSLSPTLAAGEGQEAVEGEEGEPVAGANRPQILQHVYTRAQEELEKAAAPGMGLLNKLLRTEVPSIRANQLEHYLCPQKTTITSPDGKVIELGGTGAPLVSHGEFSEALENAVDQIRTLEASGGTDRLSATSLIESVRQVAKDARGALVEGFGEESEVVQEFQKGLQPVFRPGTKV